MRVISRKKLRDFAKKHPEAEGSLNAWYYIMKHAKPETPNELRKTFPEVSFLGDNLAVFNIGSNRLEARIHYGAGIAYIVDVLTHDEYDRMNTKRKR